MVLVKLKDPQGTIILEFEANGTQPLLDQMEELAFDMPYSCRAGACMTCAVVVKSGIECVDQILGGEKFIDTDDDQILTCIAGVKEEFVKSDKQLELVIEMMDMF